MTQWRSQWLKRSKYSNSNDSFPTHTHTQTKPTQHQLHVNAPRALVSGARVEAVCLLRFLLSLFFLQASVKQRGNEGERTADRGQRFTVKQKRFGLNVDGGSTGNVAARHPVRSRRAWKVDKCLAKVFFSQRGHVCGSGRAWLSWGVARLRRIPSLLCYFSLNREYCRGLKTTNRQIQI